MIRLSGAVITPTTGRNSESISTKIYTPTTHNPFTHFEFTTLLCNFVLLIEKDGGIRPCDVLATCAYKVLRSTRPLQKWPGQISGSHVIPDFSISKFFDCTDVSWIPPILSVESKLIGEITK